MILAIIPFNNNNNICLSQSQLAADVEVDDSEYKAVNAPVVVKKKDPKARRKIREQRELKHALELRKLEKKKITDLHR